MTEEFLEGAVALSTETVQPILHRLCWQHCTLVLETCLFDLRCCSVHISRGTSGPVLQTLEVSHLALTATLREPPPGECSNLREHSFPYSIFPRFGRDTYLKNTNSY